MNNKGHESQSGRREGEGTMEGWKALGPSQCVEAPSSCCRLGNPLRMGVQEVAWLVKMATA